MTHRIVWEPNATEAALRFLRDDPAGLASVYEAVDTLAESPRPTDSTVYGPEARRLRVGRYRVLYRIETDVIRILVTHVGRTSSGHHPAGWRNSSRLPTGSSE